MTDQSRSRLMDEATRRYQASSTSHVTPVVQRKPAQQTERFYQAKKCFVCGRQGHMDCRQAASEAGQMTHSNKDEPQKQASSSQSQPRGLWNRRRPRGRGNRGRALMATSHSDGSGDGTQTGEDNCEIFFMVKDIGTKSQNNKIWVLDSGASAHLVSEKDYFLDMQPADVCVQVANGECIPVKFKGSVMLNNVGLLKDVLYVPQLDHHLLSVRKLNQDGIAVYFEVNGVFLKKQGKIIAKGKKQEGIFCLENGGVSKKEQLESANNVSLGSTPHKSNCIHLWHRRMGHLSFKNLQKLPDFCRNVEFDKCQQFLQCAVCAETKSKVHLKRKASERVSKDVFDLIHCDLIGPTKTTSLGGSRYVLNCTDDKSRYTFLYMLKNKSDAFNAFKRFCAMVEVQFGKKVKKLQIDRGTEFFSNEFTDWLEQKGIFRWKTCHFSPNQNGVAERKNGIVQQVALALISDSGANVNLWAEAMNTACYLLNRSFSSSLETTPYFIMYGKHPNLKHLRVFGSFAWVNIPLSLQRKRSMTAVKMRFLGYESGTCGYRFLSKEGKLTISNSAKFEEHGNWQQIHSNEIYYPVLQDANANVNANVPAVQNIQDDGVQQVIHPDTYTRQDAQTSRHNGGAQHTEPDDEQPGPSGTQRVHTHTHMKYSSGSSNAEATYSPGSDLSSDSDTEPYVQEQESLDYLTKEMATVKLESDDEQEQQISRRSERFTREIPPQRYSPEQFREVHFYFKVTKTPAKFSDIRKLPMKEKQGWYQSMRKEMYCLEHLKVFKEVNPEEVPKDKQVLSSRWVYKVKTMPDHSHILKSSFVACGYSQVAESDYTEIFSPTAKSDTLRLLMNFANTKGLKLFHYDVSTAYLRANLDHEIFVKPPKGFGNQNKVWLLQKALYGLKESTRMWLMRINEVLTGMGFQRLKSDPCVFKRKVGSQTQILLVFVDDLLFACKTDKDAADFEKQIGKVISIQNMGLVKKYLGLNIEQTKNGYAVNQTDKIVDLLRRCNMSHCKPTRIPLSTNLQNERDPNSPKFEDNTLYRSVIRSLLYICWWSRPDIQVAINILSRACQNPTQQDWNGIKSVLKYLKGTLNKKLYLEPEKNNKPTFKAYCAADWASDTKSRKSLSGNVVYVNNSVVSWCVRAQRFIVTSSTDSEIASIENLFREMIWLRAIVSEMWECDLDQPIDVFEDNISAIEIAYQDQRKARPKHIDIRYCVVKEAIQDNMYELIYVNSDQNIADIFTKLLTEQRINMLSEKLGLK